MSAGWGSELTELIPLALVVALSPLSIIPAVLILHTERPRPTGLAYLAGWIVGLAGLTAIFIAISGALGGMGGKPPSWASWLRIVIGAALLAFGAFRWLTRNSKPHQIPGTRHITTAGPAKALLIGALLTVVNPKVLFICAAAGLAIGTSGVQGPGTWLAEALYVLIAASTVALPILAYAISGDRLDPTLAKVKTWMEDHNAALVAAILIVIGLLVLYKGIHGL
ncbi:GAP family protein [Mycolicibacterium komossense]|uniref:GAP family protein n=1 Tax=Mycolicibacterium komossense TaxID=1779 RepID=A0ABT3CKK7_9MYCO|nr:GAP family protein [Mycolicibacterium komossense]MCV7230040.1 GAP family protein [Mycolicibacterium komossense]